MNFHENLFSGSRVVQCRQTDTKTDMTELGVAFRNFAKALVVTATRYGLDGPGIEYRWEEVFRPRPE